MDIAALSQVLIIRRFGYQLTGNGRWVSMSLKKPKKKGGEAKKPKKIVRPQKGNDSDEYNSDREHSEVRIFPYSQHAD